jgi:hypothetical protein
MALSLCRRERNRLSAIGAWLRLVDASHADDPGTIHPLLNSS